MQCVCTLWFCFLPILWWREFAYTLETSTINTALLPHQWSKVCTQYTMPGDRNSILSSHCVTFTFGWCYCGLLLRIFAFYVQCLTVAGVSQPSSNVAREFELHKSFKLIRCCIGSPGKCGEAHPHLEVNLAQPIVRKLKLHSCCIRFKSVSVDRRSLASAIETILTQGSATFFALRTFKNRKCPAVNLYYNSYKLLAYNFDSVRTLSLFCRKETLPPRNYGTQWYHLWCYANDTRNQGYLLDKDTCINYWYGLQPVFLLRRFGHLSHVSIKINHNSIH